MPASKRRPAIIEMTYTPRPLTLPYCHRCGAYADELLEAMRHLAEARETIRRRDATIARQQEMINRLNRAHQFIESLRGAN